MAYALVIAGRGGTRSRLAREVADAIAGRGLRVGGFTQRMLEPATGAKTIEIVRIRDGGSITLARSTPDAGADPAACSFAFDQAALDEASRWIDADAPQADVLVLDGLGKLELGGEGHRATIGRAVASAAVVVLAVRDDQLVYALEALGLGEPAAAYSDGDGAVALEAFVDEVVRAVRRG